MAKLTVLQSSLNAGELSPLLRGRQNVARYRDGLEKCRNALPLVTGGATRRPGRRKVAQAAAAYARLIPFLLTVDGVLVGYEIEATAAALRFYRDGARIEAAGVPVEVAHAFGDEAVKELRFAQEESALYFVHPTAGMWMLTRTSDTEWSLTQFAPTKWPYFRPAATEEITLTPSGASGNITVTASAPLFVAGHVGVRFKINGGIVEVTGFTSETSVAATVREQFPTAQEDTLEDLVTITVNQGITLESFPHTITVRTTADYIDRTLKTVTTGAIEFSMGDDPVAISVARSTLNGTQPDKHWKEQAWSAVRGWPGAVWFSGQRMLLGYTSSQPTVVWGSRIGELKDFTAGTDDDAPYAFTLAQANTRILHLAGSDEILAFTANKELTLRGSNDGAVTPTDLQVKAPTNHGSNFRARPFESPRGFIFVSTDGRELRTIQYSLEIDGYSAPDISVAAEHLADDGGGIVEAVFAKGRVPAIWAVTASGRLLSCTYDPDQEVIAWAWHEAADEYLSVSVAPDASGTDRIWVVVRRGGAAYVEHLDPALNTDSAVTGSGQVIGGLSHLEGLEVAIVADGFVLPRQVVAGGQIDLGAEYAAVEVGLPYTTTIKDLPPAIEGGAGASMSVNRIMVLLHKSQGCTLNGEQIPFNQLDGTAPGELILDTPVQSFTGWKQVNAMTGWSDEGTSAQVEIVQDLPLPLTVLAIVKEVTANAG